MRGPDFTRPLPPYGGPPAGGPETAQQPPPEAGPGQQAAWGPGDPRAPQGPPQGPSQGPPQGQPPPAPAGGRGKRRVGATVLAVALVAGLVGGGAGAGGMYLVQQNSGSQQGQSSAGDSRNLEQKQGNSGESSNAPDGSVQAVADEVLPSVVSISIMSSQGAGNGSGMVLTEDGMILTNNHVAAAGKQGQLSVTFNDGSKADAHIVGLDPATDLAVIKAEGVSDLKPIDLGTSGDLQIGEQVVAIGAPLDLAGTVTTGIVSSVQRPVRTGDKTQNTVIDAIQTDAAINPGNSGGPLVDMQGNVVGINSAIATVPSAGGSSGSIGLGFSIPVDQAKPIAEQLMEDGSAEHARLGVQMQVQNRYPTGPGQSSSTEGARIAQTMPGTAAKQAGLQPGDVVTKLNDREITGVDSLIAAVRSYRPGEKVELTYVRNGEENTVTVTLGSDANN